LVDFKQLAYVLCYISFIHVSWDDNLNIFKWMYECTYWQTLHCEKADMEICYITRKAKVGMMPLRITSLLSQFLFQYFCLLVQLFKLTWNLCSHGMGWSFLTLQLECNSLLCCVLNTADELDSRAMNTAVMAHPQANCHCSTVVSCLWQNI
jgi:hypothetical protein